MISILKEDITKIKVEAIVNSTNGLYIMNKGVSSAIYFSAGKKVQDEINKHKKIHKKLEAGSFYSTSGGNLLINGVKKIYHAVINNAPNDNTSIFFINEVMNKILERAVKDKISSIAFPGLGTGCCTMNKEVVAINMIDNIKKFCGLLEIGMVDIDEELINIFKEKING